jgi:hypothetical protein
MFKFTEQFRHELLVQTDGTIKIPLSVLQPYINPTEKFWYIQGGANRYCLIPTKTKKRADSISVINQTITISASHVKLLQELANPSTAHEILQLSSFDLVLLRKNTKTKEYQLFLLPHCCTL